MPKNADGIDNILFYFENERQSYRAGTDMIGKVDLYQIIVSKNLQNLPKFDLKVDYKLFLMS